VDRSKHFKAWIFLNNKNFFFKMKKAKFNAKLSLNKETVAKLNIEQMNQVRGGEDTAIDPNAPAEAGRLSWFRDCSHRVDCCWTRTGTGVA
jgi:hypothetical protein